MKIRVNGEEYDSWDDVPEEARRLLGKVLPDDDHNGIPDVFEGKVEPGRYGFSGKFAVSERAELRRVPRKGDRPGFRFTMKDSEVRALLPEPGEPAARTPAAPTPAADGPILLNGVEVGPDGRPLRKKRWWRRG